MIFTWGAFFVYNQPKQIAWQTPTYFSWGSFSGRVLMKVCLAIATCKYLLASKFPGDVLSTHPSSCFPLSVKFAI